MNSINKKLTFGRNISLYTFFTNMALTARMDESMDDMTAAATAPNPKNDTAAGARYWMAAGRARLGLAKTSDLFRSIRVDIQSVARDDYYRIDQ